MFHTNKLQKKKRKKSIRVFKSSNCYGTRFIGYKLFMKRKLCDNRYQHPSFSLRPLSFVSIITALDVLFERVHDTIGLLHRPDNQVYGLLNYL